jgi:ceramide glucosyltransferase
MRSSICTDDYALGNEVAKRGYHIELTRSVVWMVFSNETLTDFLKHKLRWMIQLKNLRLAGYLGMFLTFGLAWSLLVAAIVPSSAIVGGYFLAYVVLRLSLAWLIGNWGLHDPTLRRKPWLPLVRDALNLSLYPASFFSNAVQWRGMSYRLHGPFLERPRPIHGNTPAR